MEWSPFSMAEGATVARGWDDSMKRALLALGFIAGCVAGCSDQMPAGTLASVGSVVQGAQTQGAGARSTRPAATRGGFSSAPDRGDLLAYRSQVAPRRDGAYTWHRTDLSEAHALRAVDGQLTVTAPSGEVLKFDYQRHVEHPTGDWTWVGKLHGSEGETALITFGAKAAFGSIGQTGKPPLRLTIRDGVSWLVETDAAAVARIDNTATRPRAPDFLIPPKTERAADDSRSTGKLGYEGAEPPTAAPVVDVVLGYTNGFAAGLGGASQAVTRLYNLVEITNEAYANSQVNARVRLMRTVQVSYPDATPNETALEELTGYKRSIPASLQPLRAARETYGADLVSLVRKFTDPENAGCGIAWLLGGGMTPLDQTDPPYGYSIVGDGTDVGSDGKTYYCRDETLAHEFGHNMGSAHDRETAKGDDGVLEVKDFGRYPYSFGYKTGLTSGNFYTVMAYGDTGQLRYRVFSNPRITFCGGARCGILNEADNALSLEQAIPVVASFRSSMVADAPRVRNDIDADGKSDLVWVNPTAASFGYWIMSGARAVRLWSGPLGAGQRIAAAGDSNGDRRLDLFVTDAARNLWLHTGNGTTFTIASMGTYAAGWLPVASGDIDANGASDLLWLNSATNTFGYWILQGSQTLRTWTTGIGAGYRIAATGDFNGDGRLDVVWTSAARDLYLWSGNGTGFATTRLSNYGAGWSPMGAGDINADGKADLIWHNTTTNSFGYWLMDGAVLKGSWFTSISPGYRIAARGDYNGDGRLDVIWTSNARRDLYLWSGVGPGFSSTFIGNYDPAWGLADGLNQ